MSTTPILDLEQDPPAPRNPKWALVFYLAVGVAIGLAPSVFGDYAPGFNVLVWVPAVYLAIAIHELGHLAGGSLAGMPPGILVIGGFVSMRSGDRWIFRFDYRRILGGGCAGAMTHKGQVRPDLFLWMVAGGPFASLVMTCVMGLVFLRFGTGAGDWIGTLFWAAATTLLSLVPISSGMSKSDGARLWMLLTRPDESRRWMAAGAVRTEDSTGVRPRDWDAGLVEQMLAGDAPASEAPFTRLMVCYRSMDLGDDAAAMEHLERALAGSARSGKIIRQCLFLEAAAVAALGRANAQAAHIWLERALKLRKPPSAHGARAAIAVCEGRYDDAIVEIQGARTFLNRMKADSGLARFCRQKLNELETQCQEAKSAELSSDRATTSASA